MSLLLFLNKNNTLQSFLFVLDLTLYFNGQQLNSCRYSQLQIDYSLPHKTDKTSTEASTRHGQTSKKLLWLRLNWFYRRLTSPSASAVVHKIYKYVVRCFSRRGEF